MHGEGSTNRDVAYLSVEGFTIRCRKDGEEGVAHKHGLAVRIYDRLFIRTEFSALPSDGRRISRIQSDSCERHCICQEDCDRYQLQNESAQVQYIISETTTNVKPPTSVILLYSRLVWVILERIFPKGFRFRRRELSFRPNCLHFHDALWNLSTRRRRRRTWLRHPLRIEFIST